MAVHLKIPVQGTLRSFFREKKGVHDGNEVWMAIRPDHIRQIGDEMQPSGIK